MSPALIGEHYCVKHQGNHSHYAEHNCVVCNLRAQLAAAIVKLEAQEIMLGKANTPSTI